MAKKKSKPEGESPKRRVTKRSDISGKAQSSPPRSASRKPPELESSDTIRERAESLLHVAFDSDDPVQVTAFAREALEVWPDCADAFVLLAELAKSPKEALDLYTEAVAAGERDLGAEAFRDLAGHFWNFIPSRPYMRARFGLAQALWVLGRRIEAIEHYQDMLRLNPGDNQGVRYNLAACLLELGRDDELASLLETFEDDASASWAYSAALLAFRREGDSLAARKLLAAARKCNKFVPDFLIGREIIPSRMPDLIGVGDREEAVDYAVGFLNAWRGTPSALNWLRRSVESKASTRTRPKPKPGRGPTAAAKARLKRLPQPSDVVWQAEYRRLPMWMNIAGEYRRPWIVLIVSKTHDLILGQEVIEDHPSPALLWDKLTLAMSNPAAGPPHRPSQLEIRNSEVWTAVTPHLDAIEVLPLPIEPLELIDDILVKLVEHLCGHPASPRLLDMPGVTEPQVASFFQAAASFYRAAPWQRVGGAETIRIACDSFESGPWYAVIIGQMGMTLGVALYENPKALVRMRDGNTSDEHNARETVALSVTFGDETEIPAPDLDAAEQHGWEVAAPEAYPAPIRKERGLVMRPPLSWELRLLEATLRALPDFIATHDRDNPVPKIYDLPTSLGPLALTLSWLADDDL